MKTNLNIIREPHLIRIIAETHLHILLEDLNFVLLWKGETYQRNHELFSKEKYVGNKICIDLYVLWKRYADLLKLELKIVPAFYCCQMIELNYVATDGFGVQQIDLPGGGLKTFNNYMIRISCRIIVTKCTHQPLFRNRAFNHIPFLIVCTLYISLQCVWTCHSSANSHLQSTLLRLEENRQCTTINWLSLTIQESAHHFESSVWRTL